jgi:peroxiredoxin
MIAAVRAVLAGAAALAALAGPVDLPVGRTAPHVTLHTIDGQRVRLADRRGRVLLVDFWASWCGPCKTTFPALQALATRLKPHGVNVLAISEDEDRKALDAFLTGHPATVDVLVDPHMAAARAFGVRAIPTAFVLDAAGTVRFSHPAYSMESVTVIERELTSLVSAGDLHMAGASSVQ